MTRVKRGVAARASHKKVLRLTKGQWGSRHRLFRRANEAMLRSLRYSYADRRARKAQFRRIWIARINAASRMSGLSYGKFMHGLKLAGITIDRNVLADLAVRDLEAFGKLAEQAKQAVGAV